MATDGSQCGLPKESRQGHLRLQRGAGSSDHLTAALFWQRSGTTGIHVPYKGGAPAIQDLLGGHAQASFQNVNAVLPHIKSGKLKALAVTGEKRSAALPDVPTLSESGVTGADVYSWQGVAEQGFEVVANTPEQFAQFLQQELAKWKAVIEAGKITLD